MSKIEFENLRRGDIIRNIGSGESYVIEQQYDIPAKFIAVHTVTVTNPDEWELVVT